MAVTETEVVALELEKVLPKVQTLFERDDKFYATIEKKNVEKISQRQMRVPLEIRPGGSFQYVSMNGGDLGRGGGQQWDKAVLSSVFVSENIEYTKLAQYATDDNRKAVQNAVRELTAKGLDELRRQLDGQSMQDGSGKIGTVTSDTPSGGSSVIVCTSDGFGVRLMRYGQTIQVWNSGGTTNKGTGVITGWDVVNCTITVTPQIGAGATAGDIIVTAGITDPTAFQGIFGVAYHDNSSSSGTWLGFDRNSTPEIRASRVNANNASLSLPLPRLAINQIGNRVGIDNNFNPVAWMHPCQAQAYEEIGQLVMQVWKDPKDQKFDGYFDGMQMAGAMVRKSFNWNQKRIDFVSDSVWGRGEILPIGFYTTDGRKIFEIRGSSGGVVTADIFYLTVGMQIFLNNPAAAAYIDSLAVPSGYIG